MTTNEVSMETLMPSVYEWVIKEAQLSSVAFSLWHSRSKTDHCEKENKVREIRIHLKLKKLKILCRKIPRK